MTQILVKHRVVYYRAGPQCGQVQLTWPTMIQGSAPEERRAG